MPGTHDHLRGGGIELVGDTLILREFDDADLDGVQSYACDPVVTRFLEWGPNSVEDTPAASCGARPSKRAGLLAPSSTSRSSTSHQSADFVIDNDDPTHPRLHRTSVR